MFAFRCPRCRRLFEVSEAAAGKKTACPACGQLMRISPRVAVQTSALPTSSRGRNWWDISVLVAAIVVAIGVVGGCSVCCAAGWLGARPSASGGMATRGQLMPQTKSSPATQAKPPVTRPEPSTTVNAADRQQIIKLTNEFRKERRLSEFSTNEKLMRIAQEHAENMARQEMLEHDLDGKGPGGRAARVGYIFEGIAENIVGGVPIDEDAPGVFMESWKGSPGHRANMEDGSLGEIGVGFAKSAAGNVYACQVFGSQRK